MKGDFSRHTFDATKHFSRVLLQQGRVQLDADWNEQVSILLHYLQTLATDLIGPHGGPAGNGLGFTIAKTEKPDYNFKISSGRYYVNGRLCENENTALTYATQSDYPLTDTTKLSAGTYLVYLDVWERLMTVVEDDQIREVALGGQDTAVRSKLVWQVKTERLDGDTNCDDMSPGWSEWVEKWQPAHRGQLKADAKKSVTVDTAPCLIAPNARYRGAENQLYRVEIHHGSYDIDGKEQTPRFKWSRENGSVVFPIRELSGKVATVEHLGRDGRFTLRPGDWVEIVDDDYVNQRDARRLLKVQSIDRVERRVTLAENPDSDYGQDANKHPLLRRWEGYGEVVESDHQWLTLEDGVQIQFQPLDGGTHQYRTGDYWLIPARTATGDIEWPEDEIQNPKALGPQGEHVYAPLAIITVSTGGTVTVGDDCRCSFEPLLCSTPAAKQDK